MNREPPKELVKHHIRPGAEVCPRHALHDIWMAGVELLRAASGLKAVLLEISARRPIGDQYLAGGEAGRVLDLLFACSEAICFAFRCY